MHVLDTRYLINTYLQMAKLTTDEDQRKMYVRKAEELLMQKMDSVKNISEYSDSIDAFLHDCPIKANDNLNELYSIYLDWCKEYRNVPLHKHEFSKQIQKRTNFTTNRRRIDGEQIQVFVSRNGKQNHGK